MKFRKSNMFYITICFVVLLAISIWIVHKNYIKEGVTSNKPAAARLTSKRAIPAPTSKRSTPAPTTKPSDTEDEAGKLLSGPSKILSDVSNKIYSLKFKSIDQQIDAAMDLIGKIYGKIPISINDVTSGSITTIPYEIATTQNSGVHITINVLPKLDNNKNQIYYAIGSDGIPILYNEEVASSKTGWVSKLDNTMDPYKIVFPACRWVIDMAIPIGPKGDKGEIGQPGQIGAAGATGSKGDTGFIGNWGTP
jgi:hypothetical protein